MTPDACYLFKDNPALAKAYAQSLSHWLDGRSPAAIALSGGSTPSLLFRVLAEDFRQAIDWSGVHLFWGDERCVPPDHPESNFGVARDLLLDHIDIPGENIHRIRGEAEPEAEARRYAAEIRQHLPVAEDGWPVFDLVLLGMGADGHTASIFPHQMNLLHATEVCAVARHPETGQRRVTLTGRVINRSKHVSFLVTGASKTRRVHEILGQFAEGKVYPAAHIHPAGRLTWWLDEAAAADLRGATEGEGEI